MGTGSSSRSVATTDSRGRELERCNRIASRRRSLARMPQDKRMGLARSPRSEPRHPAHIPLRFTLFAIQATTHPALIPHEAAGSSRPSPRIPANGRVEEACSQREYPPIPAQAASAKTGLSRRRSRVRVPSLPLGASPLFMQGCDLSLCPRRPSPTPFRRQNARPSPPGGPQRSGKGALQEQRRRFPARRSTSR